MLMGRQLRSKVPSSPAILHPYIPNLDSINEADKRAKLRPKENFDQCHRVHLHSICAQGEEIYITDLKTNAVIINYWTIISTCCIQIVALLSVVMVDYYTYHHHHHRCQLLTYHRSQMLLLGILKKTYACHLVLLQINITITLTFISSMLHMSQNLAE